MKCCKLARMGIDVDQCGSTWIENVNLAHDGIDGTILLGLAFLLTGLPAELHQANGSIVPRKQN